MSFRSSEGGRERQSGGAPMFLEVEHKDVREIHFSNLWLSRQFSCCVVVSHLNDLP